MNDSAVQQWIIETTDLTKIYGNGNEVRALDAVNIRVARGEFIAVMGPSGSGKSTLLNLLGALDRPTRGAVFINGCDMAAVKDLDTFRARTVGFVFQLHNLIPTLDALENIETPMMGQPLSVGKRRKRALELLQLVGLSDRAHHLPAQLSGGQRQRVAIARALANQPALVLADEPTGNLDSYSGGEVIALMRQLNRELGATFILVTHDPSVARQTQRVLVMRDGKIADDHRVGNPYEEDLKAFRQTGLAQAVLSGDRQVLENFPWQEREALRLLLRSEGGGP